jgi:hypothetical protein
MGVCEGRDGGLLAADPSDREEGGGESWWPGELKGRCGRWPEEDARLRRGRRVEEE